MPTSEWNTRYPMNIQRGSDFWDDDLNAILDTLAVDVEIRDLLNNRSNYTERAQAGSKYLAIDTGDVYRYNGSEWKHVPTTGRRPAFESLSGPLTGDNELTSLLSESLSIVDGSLTVDRYTDAEAQDAVTGSVNITDLVSGSIGADLVPKSDGSGGVSWEVDSTAVSYTDDDARSAVTGSVDIADLVSGQASANSVPKADGSGGVSWETATEPKRVISITADQTLSPDDVALVDASNGDVTITLPDPPTSGDIVDIKATDTSNVVRIDTPGSQAIDGQRSVTIDEQYDSLTIASDGSDYFIL